MTTNASENLAHKRAVAALLRAGSLCLLGGLHLAAASRPPAASDAPVPPQQRPPVILALILPHAPAPGKGRLALAIAGNRRWCTYPDDRIVRPAQKPGAPRPRNEVFTFGYKFSVSAIKRGQADTPLMLFESPVFRTATWLPASKLGRSQKSNPKVPIVAPEGESQPKQKTPPSPSTLVPYWNELNRCVTVPDRLDFDLDPGTYDVYVAFDLLNREQSWVHRSTAFLTDIPVESDRRTRLEGLVNLGAGSERQVELNISTIEPDPSASSVTEGP